MSFVKRFLIISFCFILFACEKKVSKSNEETSIIDIATESNVIFKDSIKGYISKAYNNINEEKNEVKEEKEVERNYIFGQEKDRCPILSVYVKNDPVKNNYISLTFDCSFENRYTYQILNILDDYDAKATFFMTGEFISRNIEQVKQMISRGHDIGNHSATHPDFRKISDEKKIEEISIPDSIIKEKLNKQMNLFRFPYGGYNEESVKILKNLNYYPIQWTFDSVDWKNESLEMLLKKFQNGQNLEPGFIILFHNGAKRTPEALPYILEMIKSKGLKCVKVSDLIYKDNFYIDGWGTQCKKK